MPKLPCVSGAKVAKALERLGFVRQRQKGSHLVMRRGRQRLCRADAPRGGSRHVVRRLAAGGNLTGRIRGKFVTA